MSQNVTIICELAVFLDGFWEQFKGGADSNDSENRERQILLSSIMRIMCQIISKMPFSDIPSDTVHSVMNISFKQASESIKLAQLDYVLCDYSLTYLSCLARAMLKIQTTSGTMPQEHQEAIHASLLILLKMVQDESDFGNFFVVIEDLVMLCLHNNQQLFYQQLFVEFKQFLVAKRDLNTAFSKNCVQVLKIIISMTSIECKQELEKTTGEFLQHTLAAASGQLNDSEYVSEFYDSVVAPLISSIIVLVDQPAHLPQLFQLLQEQIPNFINVAMSKQSSSGVSMPSNCLITGMCFSYPQLKESINATMSTLEQDKQFQLMDKLSLCRDVLVSYINAEIVNRIEGKVVLTNQHLMDINEE